MSLLDDKIEMLAKKITRAVLLSDVATLQPLITDILSQMQSEDRPRWRGTSAGVPSGTAFEGDLYFDSGTTKVYIYANATWTLLN